MPASGSTRSRLPHIRCFTVSRENRSQLAIPDDSIFYVNPTPYPSFGYEKTIPCLRCDLRCHLGKSWSISRLQLFTAAWLGHSGRRPSFRPKPRLSDVDPSPSLEQPWKAIDFRQQPAAYMQAVIDYCYEGNLEVEFRGQDNATRKWYHAPWLHPGPNGREFTHGLTGERLSRTRELAATQSSPSQFRCWSL